MKQFSKLNEEYKPANNAELFRDWLSSVGSSYGKVREILNRNGIHEFNDIITENGDLVKKDGTSYLGKLDYHGCDNGARDHASKELACIIGNVQETLFCLDNSLDFDTNSNATRNGVTKDEDITAKKLDLIHKKTNKDVELKCRFVSNIHPKYQTVTYKHRNGNFDKFMKSGKILLVYYPYLNKIAVIDNSLFQDPLKKDWSKPVRIIGHDVDGGGIHWDVVSIRVNMMFDYTMMKGGNHLIGEEVTKLIENRK